ncbi:hypothetical protein CASFOL_033894 [Castilleja foliolosa]|uniref:Uncharacterized protein n=1 Tax=Castilleja foliolosa TaxID=1961234 RepID=A0ABD3BY91_9LAMI
MDFDIDIKTDIDCDLERDSINKRRLPPCPVKTKRSGAGGRHLKSLKEQAIEKSKKPLRLFRKCNQKTTHDSHNCEKIKGVVYP